MTWKLKMDVAGRSDQAELLRALLEAYELEYWEPFRQVRYERDTSGEVIAFWVA